MRPALLVLLLCGVCRALSGQISGAVQDTAGAPVVDAYVFVPGTQSWDLTDTDGAFNIEWQLDEPVGVVCSHVAYASQHVQAEPGARQLRFALTPANIHFDEVVIAANASNKRKRWMKQFEQAFLGSTRNARDCQIVNPEALLFEESGDRLVVHTTDLLEVMNDALGYRIFLLLEMAEKQGDRFSYHARTLFEGAVPVDAVQEQQWEIRRDLAYRGSLTHFLRTLIDDALHAEGFEIGHSVLRAGVMKDLGPADRDRILTVAEHRGDTTFYLNFEGFLKVTYYNERSGGLRYGDVGTIAERLRHPAEQELVQHSEQRQASSRDFQVSHLFMRKHNVQISRSGLVTEGNYIEEYGHMSQERVAEMVPLEYGY